MYVSENLHRVDHVDKVGYTTVENSVSIHIKGFMVCGFFHIKN